MTPSVAVVVPTRNRGALLVGAVRSTLAADPPPDEIVIADGGSSDGSVEEAAGLDSRVRIVRGDFANAAATRNAGVRACTGELIAFLDSDDEMAPGKIGCLQPAFDDPAVVLAHGETEVIDERGDLQRALTDEHRALFRRAAAVGTGYAALAGFCAMFTSATIVRRSAFDAVGGYDESLEVFEDWDLYLRLSLLGRLVYAPCSAARYRVWPGNVGWDKTARGIVAVADRHLETLPPLAGGLEDRARYGFNRRLAEAHHVLVERGPALAAAARAARIAPLRALRDPVVRRVFLRAAVPTAVLRRRRPATDRQ